MAWIYLVFAGVFEICWAIGLKHCDGFKINLALIFVVISMIISFSFFSIAIKTIPMGVAYAVWTSIGIIGVFIYGVTILKEPFSISTMVFISMILIGIIGLKLQVK